jgi:hypothetical protein
MAAEGDLVLELGMTMTRLNRQLAAAEQRFSRAAAKIERGFNAKNTAAIEQTIAATSRLERGFARVGQVAGTVLGVVIGQGLLQIATRTRATIAALSNLAKEADRVGASVEEWQALQFGFGLEGVTNADFTKALETFSQRIGEAAEGSGELYKVLRANGIALRNSAGEIRPVNDLLREFAELIQRTGSESSQLALINDAFGRGGRDMVNALRGGAEGLNAMVASAREAGVVLDESVIRRAEIIDDKFETMTAQMKVYFQEVAVFGGEAVIGIKMMMEDLVALFDDVRAIDAILQENANAAAVLGDAVVNAMDAAGDATEAQEIAARQLISLYNQLAGQATNLAAELDLAATSAEQLGMSKSAEYLQLLAERMREADRAFQEGKMSTDDLNDALTRVTAGATDTLVVLQNIDGVSFDRAINQAGRLAIALYDAAIQAATLRAELPGGGSSFIPVGGPGTFPVGDNSGNFNSPSVTAPRTAPRPPARSGIDFGYSPATGGGRGGSPGGGSSAAQEPEWWDDLIEKVREGEQAWEDYNRTVEDGALAMADFFGSIVDGSKSAKEALADLLMQLAQVQFQKAFLGLAGGGGAAGSIFSALGSALTVPSFDGGGYTGSGARSGGVDGKGGFPALLHPNETVIDHSKGGSGGGGQVSVVVRMENGNLVPVIESVSGSVTARAMSAYDRQLAGRVRQISGDRRSI